jgi:hypothetical protein
MSRAQQRHAAEDARIATMLTTLFGSTDEPNAVTTLRRGHENALQRMQRDSHEARLTFILPPTASMPGAAYSPEMLFGPRG